MKRILALLFFLTAPLLTATAGVPYVINSGTSTNVHLTARSVTIDNLNGKGSGLGSLVAHAEYSPIEDDISDSGDKETGVNTYTVIPFQDSIVWSGGYNTNGTFTNSIRGTLRYNLLGYLGGAAGIYPTNGTIVGSRLAVSSPQVARGGTGFATSPTSLIQVPQNIAVINVSGMIPVVEDSIFTFSVLGQMSLSIGNFSVDLELFPEKIPLNARYVLDSIATNMVAACRFQYTGGQFPGTNFFAPSADGTYDLMVVRDAAMGIRGALDIIPAQDIRDIVIQSAYLQGKHDDGLAIGITRAGALINTNLPSQVDHSFEFIDLIYSDFLKTGTADAFTAYSLQASNAFNYQTVSNHLVYLWPAASSNHVGWGFEDSEAMRGYNLTCSLYRYRSCQQLAEMLTFLGRSTDAAFYTAELPLIRSNLETYLYDPSLHLFYEASVASNNTQHAVMGSAYAVVIGAGRSALLDDISTQLYNMLPGGSEDIAGRGAFVGAQVRHMPKNEQWANFISTLYPIGAYQNGGYWAIGTAWCAKAIARLNPAAGDALMEDLAKRFYNTKQSLVPYEYESPPNFTGAAKYFASGCLPRQYYSTNFNR